jgi:hypothetical protein
MSAMQPIGPPRSIWVVRRADWEFQFTEYFTARVQPLRRLPYGLCGDWHTADDPCAL